MSTIGVGKAFRDQDRAARQSRERRAGFQRAVGTSELPEVAGLVSCVACADQVPRADVMFGERGSLCPACFGEAESRDAHALVPTSGRRALQLLVRPVPLWLAAGFFAWVSAPWIFTPVTHSIHGLSVGKGAVGWMVLVGSVAVLGLVSSMQALRDLRTASLPSIEDGTRSWSMIAPAAGGALATALPTVALAVIAVLPILLAAL